VEIESVNTIQMIAAGVGGALLIGGAISAFGGRLKIPAIVGGALPINSDKPAPEGTARVRNPDHGRESRLYASGATGLPARRTHRSSGAAKRG
jgi:hypothetical protein